MIQNDLLYAQLQLNGEDDINKTAVPKSELKNIENITEREPYLYTENSHMYMYVGVSDGKAVDLRVKESDNAKTADTSRAVQFDAEYDGLFIGPDKKQAQIQFYPAGQFSEGDPTKRDGQSVLIQSHIILGSKGKNKDTPYPKLQGFNIEMESETTIGPAYTGPGKTFNETVKMTGCAVLNVPVFTLVKGQTYGTVSQRNALTNVQEGQVFFVVPD